MQVQVPSGRGPTLYPLKVFCFPVPAGKGVQGHHPHFAVTGLLVELPSSCKQNMQRLHIAFSGKLAQLFGKLLIFPSDTTAFWPLQS